MVNISKELKVLNTGQILQQLIQFENITVAELARRVGLPQPTIQRIASGAYKQPRTSTLEPIAEYFGVSIHQLRGLVPILPPTFEKKIIKAIPLLNLTQINQWPKLENTITQHVICDHALSKEAFAMYMPDSSMEPEIIKGTTLLIDPYRLPNHGSYIVVKVKAHPTVLVRQLITNSAERLIRPLNQELNFMEMITLKDDDIIKGVIVEIRFCCE